MLPGNQILKSLELLAKVELADSSVAHAEPNVNMEGGHFSRRIDTSKLKSYENMIDRPDMHITVIDDSVEYKANSQTRKHIVRKTIENAAKVGKINDDGSVSVYVEDIGSDVTLAVDGLRHGLDRRLNKNAAVTLNAGKILKSAILVNELTPKNTNASGSYVLLGMAKNKSNEPYVVEFVVNSFDNEITSVNVLYSANAKKESAVLNAPALTESPLRITDSTISISEFLDLSIGKFPDILPESVLKHYGYDSRPNGKLGNSALYSMRPANLEGLRQIYGTIRSTALTTIDLLISGNE